MDWSGMWCVWAVGCFFLSVVMLIVAVSLDQTNKDAKDPAALCIITFVLGFLFAGIAQLFSGGAQ